MAALFNSIESSGLIFNQQKCLYPSEFWTLKNSKVSFEESYNNTFGFVQSGTLTLTPHETGGSYSITQGMYFSVPGALQAEVKGDAVLFRRLGHRGLFTIGGPLENNGRLCYIDNCTTTVLVPAARLGDACLNLLVFPENIKQTLHIHPSIRFGIVVAGSGVCFNPNDGERPLKPGMIFCLEETYPHCFNSGPQGLKIVAYHPDSDMGPTDQHNPMLNRTFTRF